MPVVTKPKLEALGEIQVGPRLNGSTLAQTVAIYRRHHETCSMRRKDGVNYEIRMEADKTEWLKRKYLDNLRQQSALSGRLDSHRNQLEGDSTEASGGSADGITVKQSPSTPDKAHLEGSSSSSNGKTTPDSKKFNKTVTNGSGEIVDPLAAHFPTPHVATSDCSNSANGHHSSSSVKGSSSALLDSGNRARGSSSSGGDSFMTVGMSIKTEPGSGEDAPHHHCMRSPPAPQAVSTIAATTNGGSSTSSTAGRGTMRTPPTPSVSHQIQRARRLSISKGGIDHMKQPLNMRSSSFSGSDANDLTISADDCIHGVLSTPPIKALEGSDDVITTPSPPLSASMKNDTPSSASNLNLNPTSVATTFSNSSTQPSGATQNSTTTQAPQQDSGPQAAPSATIDLAQDLDEFSKVMDQVTKEQKAKERRASYSSLQQQQQPEVYPTTQSPHLSSPPPPYSSKPQHHQTRPSYYPSTPQGGGGAGGGGAGGGGYPGNSRLPSYPHSQFHTSHNAQVDSSFQHQPSNPIIMQRASDHIQKHPQLQHLSAVSQMHAVSSQQHKAGAALMSPSHYTPTMSSHFSSNTNPTSSVAVKSNPQLPQTPTTPLEHFKTFPPPLPAPLGPPLPSLPHSQQPQVQSPTHHPHSFLLPTASAAYPYGQSTQTGVQPPVPLSPDHQKVVMQSPTVSTQGGATAAAWGNMQQPPPAGHQGNAYLKDSLLSQVHSRIDAIRGSHKRLASEAGLAYPAPVKTPHVTSVLPLSADPMQQQPQPQPHALQQQQQQQQHSSGGGVLKYPGVGATIASYTGPSLPHTISYQAHGSYHHHHAM